MNLTERTNAALAWIDAQIALCNAATKGAWRVDGVSSAMVWSTDIRPTLISTRSSDEDAAFIADARAGYPAMLESAKNSLLAFREIEEHGFCHCEKAINFILTKIENLK